MSKKQGETSFKETAFGIIPRSKLIILEIEGVKRAWDFIKEKKRKNKLSIDPKFLEQVHQIGFGWIFPKMGGRFRKIDVKVSEHTPPRFFEVPSLMIDFTKDLQLRIKNLPLVDEKNFLDELVSLLAWSHHRFLWIHPFSDYNGRVGRLLNNIILLNLNLPPIELKIETFAGRKRYIEALKLCDNYEYSKMEKIIKDGIIEAIKSLESQH